MIQHVLKGRKFLSAAALGLGLLCTSVSQAATWSCANASALTNALANCVRGDTIILNAGTTYDGNFHLRNITTGPTSGYVTIQSSNMTSLPGPGVRVKPSDAVNMPKVRATVANLAAFQTDPSAHHFKLIGLEICREPSALVELVQLLRLVEPTSLQNALSLVPNNLIIDRCYIHGPPGQFGSGSWTRRAISMNTASTDVTNCYISDIQSGNAQSAGIGGHNGPGPFNIINNYIAAGGENFIYGGDPSHITGMVPSDFLVKENHFHKPIEWMGVAPRVCNLFEIKVGRRVTIEGNIFENSWDGEQNGGGILFKLDDYQPCTWNVTEDVTFRNNIVAHVNHGLMIQGRDYANNSPTGLVRRITVSNNLFYDMHSTYGGNGRWLYLAHGSLDCTFDHNTAFQENLVILMDPYTPVLYGHVNFTYKNNLSNHGTVLNDKGIDGNGYTYANPSITAYMNNFGGFVYQKNVMMGGNAADYNLYTGGWSPNTLGFPTTWTGNLVNYSSPGADFAGYKVVNGSAYDNTGTDGKDIGCDIDAVNNATYGCKTGVWSVSKTLKNGVNGYTGGDSFYVSGAAPTTHYNEVRAYMTANAFAGTNSSVLRSFYKFDVSPAGSGIPAGAVIDSAKLRMKLEFLSGANTINCHQMAPTTGFTVSYSAATRNTYNGTTAWTGGANAAGDVANSNNDYIDTPVSSLPSPAVGTWLEFDVKSSVQAYVNGTPNNGWLINTNTATIRTSTPNDTAGSSEYAELVVTYH